jgi:hypothetical protein
MDTREASIRNFIAAIQDHVGEAVSGGFGVTFVFLAVVFDNVYAKIIFGGLACCGLSLAAYRIWRSERIHTIELAHRVASLEDDLSPKMKLSFVNETGIMAVSGFEIDPITKVSHERYLWCVRIQVDAVSNATVKNCTAAIIRLSSKEKAEVDFAIWRLPGTIAIAASPFEVRPGIPVIIDFLKTSIYENRPRPGSNIQWPSIFADIIQSEGTYRFDIAVNGGNRTEIIRVDLDWDGNWNSMWGRQVPME